MSPQSALLFGHRMAKGAINLGRALMLTLSAPSRFRESVIKVTVQVFRLSDPCVPVCVTTH